MQSLSIDQLASVLNTGGWKCVRGNVVERSLRNDSEVVHFSHENGEILVELRRAADGQICPVRLASDQLTIEGFGYPVMRKVFVRYPSMHREHKKRREGGGWRETKRRGTAFVFVRSKPPAAGDTFNPDE